MIIAIIGSLILVIVAFALLYKDRIQEAIFLIVLAIYILLFNLCAMALKQFSSLI